MACKQVFENIEDKSLNTKFNEVYKKYKNSEYIKPLIKGEEGKYFAGFYERVTGRDLFWGGNPTRKELKKLDQAVYRMEKDVKKTPNSFSKWMLLPEAILDKNPITNNLYNAFIRVGNFYRGNWEKHISGLNHIQGHLFDAIRVEGSNSPKKALKELQRRELKFKQLWEIDKSEAKKYYHQNLSVKALAGDNQLRILERTEKIFRDKKYINTEKNTALSQAATKWHEMRDDLYNILESGLKKHVDILKMHTSSYNNFSKIAYRIEELSNLLIKNKDYFPTDVMNNRVFPLFAKLHEKVNENLSTADIDNLTSLVDKTIESIDKGQKIPVEAMPRGEFAPKYRSKDILSVLDRYIKNVIKFNHSAHMTKEYVGAMRKLAKLEGSQLEQSAKFLMNYITDMHSTAIGTHIKNPQLNKVARVITSWEFISKLGYNYRGALRNSTQSLQHLVYYGYKPTFHALKKLSNDATLKEVVNKEMQNHGVFFVNLEEIAMENSLHTSIKEGKDGVRYEDYSGFGTRLTEVIENIAKHTSKPMQWVENKVNRAVAFKIGFVQHYEYLSRQKSLIQRELAKDNPSMNEEKIMEAVNKQIIRKSSNFAAKAVKDIHYEYSLWAKPKVLRNPIGSVLGQFSTYGLNFFNYNVKIAKEGKNAALTGEWTSPEALRAFRLASFYAMIEGVLSPLFNTDLGNLIQHDSKERLGQFYTWMTGDKKERERQFFGKGPIIGTLGGPFVSDLITFGKIAGLVKMDKDSFMSYLAGYQDFAERTKDEKVFDVVRTLNTQFARTFFTTWPRMVNGVSLPVLVGQEAGLYKKPEIMARKDKVFRNKYMKALTGDLFTTSKEKKARQEYLEQLTKGSKSNNKQQQMAEYLQALLQKNKGVS